MQEGWECKKCHNVYSPNMPFCLYCWFQKNNNQNIPIAEISNETIKETVIQQEITNQSDTEISKKNIIIQDKDNIELPQLNKSKIEIPLKKYPDTKIYLSGIGHAKERAIKRDFKVPYILDTIMDFPQRPTPIVYKYFDYIKNNNIEYLLDSGAFSYMSNPKKKLDLDSLMNKYIYYIKEFNIKYYFEMDLDILMPLEEVEILRKRLYKETSTMPLIVWHDTRGEEYWDNMCKNNEFIAYGGLAVNASLTMSRINDLIERVDRAHAYGTRVHGLGFCPLSLLNTHEIMFDTVDTTSWNTTKQGYESIIDETGCLKKVPMEFYYSSIEPQEKCLKTWATMAMNYKGKNS